jgi:hypothetical protein
VGTSPSISRYSATSRQWRGKSQAFCLPHFRVVDQQPHNILCLSH